MEMAVPETSADSDAGPGSRVLDLVDAHATLLARQDGFLLDRLDRALPRFHVPERVVWTRDTPGAFSEGGCREYGTGTLGVRSAGGAAAVAVRSAAGRRS